MDARGVPLSLAVSGANRHKVQLLPATLAASVTPCPASVQPHLCANAGYKGQSAHDTMVAAGYQPHVRPRRTEAANLTSHRQHARRWVVECSYAWFNRFR